MIQTQERLEQGGVKTIINKMEYNLTLNLEQIQVLSLALGKLPFEIVAPVINVIQKQINEQDLNNKKEEK